MYKYNGYCMAQLFRRETSCFEPPRSGFTDMGSIPGQCNIMDVPDFDHEVNRVLWALFSNVYRVILIYEMHGT